MRIKELGHVVLYVSSLERSVYFYRDILGFSEVGRMNLGTGGAVTFSSGRTHHELMLIGIGGKPREKHIPEPGLYHIGFKIGDSHEDIVRAYEELKEAGIALDGSSDHTVTHSLYIHDPDGNDIELYADVSDEWKRDPSALLSPVKPLSLK